MSARPQSCWKCRDRKLETGAQTFVMGILNATPDSFYDGGRHLDPGRAVAHGLRMASEGAAVIDVGGESTRPGSEPVPAEEEIRRVVPVIQQLARQVDCLISVDTTKASVAARALEAGAHIINDVSALTRDPEMARVAVESRAGVVLMHMRGVPRTMQQRPVYRDVVEDIRAYLAERLRCLADAGLEPEALIVDPGIGFGKTVEHNLVLLARLDRLLTLGRPVLVGLSRKSFLGRITGCEPENRLAASLGAAAYALARGAHGIRVHDVKESCEVARVVDRLRAKEHTA